MGLLERSKSLRGLSRSGTERGNRVGEKHAPVDGKTGQRAVGVTPSDSSESRRVNPQRPMTARKAMDRSKELQIPGQTIEITTADTTFNFPTPSPRLPHSATFHESGSPGVGIAIGSPRQAPAYGRSFTTGDIAAFSRHQAPRSGELPAPPADMVFPGPRPQTMKQKSAWKTLGGLFQRRPSNKATRDPFYNVQFSPPPREDSVVGLPPAQLAATVGSPIPSVAAPQSISSYHSHTPSHSRGIARQAARAEWDRSALEKKLQNSEDASSNSRPRMAHVSTNRSLQPRMSEDLFSSQSPSRVDSPMSTNKAAARRRLDIDIPNADMERYSVMFEKLLEPKPSLLARRNGTLERLESPQPLQFDKVAVPAQPEREAPPVPSPGFPRRVSSLALRRKPASALTRNTSVRTTNQSPTSPLPLIAPTRPQPLKRSDTEPAAAPYFSRSTLTLSRAFDRNGGSPEPSSPAWSEPSLPFTPPSSDKQTFVSFDNDDDIKFVSRELTPLVPPLDEPSWDMLTSKPVQARESHEQHPRVKSPEDLERQMVQVSMARQISVSKAPKHAPALNSKQPLKPRMVELKNRESTVVLIEDA